MNEKTCTSRERVKNVFSHIPVDRIPKGELVISDDAICTDGSICVGYDEKYAFIQNLGLDIVTLSPGYTHGQHQLPLAAEILWPQAKRWVTESSLFTFAILDGAFEWGLKIWGWEHFLIELVRNPDSTRDFIQQVENLNLAMMEELIGDGMDGIILADDIAHQNGLFIQPDTLRRLFIPSLTRQVEFARSHNLPIMFHSDGNYLPVLKDIVGAGFSGLQCLEKSASMKIGDIQNQIKEDICLWGHLEVSDIPGMKDPSASEKLIQDIRHFATGGHFILGTTCGLYKGIDIPLLKILYGMT